MDSENTNRKYGIGELDGDVSIEVKSEDKNVTLTSRIVEKGIEFVDVIPFTYEGKIVSFKGKGLHIKLSAMIESMHIEFGVSKIALARDENGTYSHRVYSSEKNKCKNLREYKRFSLIEEGTIKLLGSQKVIDCVVKDISYGGFGIALKGRQFVPVKELLNLTFDCHIGTVPLTIHTNGLIARADYIGERDETVVGVKLLVNNMSVREAVNQIQRVELQKLKH